MMKIGERLIPPLVAAIMLFLAMADLPYGYYQILRWVICGIAVYVAYMAYRWGKIWATWVFGLIAVLFNPLIPVHLTKEIWRPINFVCACLFVSIPLILKYSPLTEAFEILDEATDKFGADFNLIRQRIEGILRSNAGQSLAMAKKSHKLREYVYSQIANVAGDMAESGQYHLYRGILNSMGPGPKLLGVFDAAIDELVRLGSIDAVYAQEQKKAIRDNIKGVG